MKNFILDVDGTLWDSTEVVARAWNEAIATHGGSKVRVTADKLKALFGRPMDVIGDMLFTDASKEVRAELLEQCEIREQSTLDQGEYNILYPEVIETLRDLHAQGCQLFIVSNCQCGYIELFIRKNQIQDIISDHLCFGDTGKSKGENIKTIIERNHLDPGQCFYVGDTKGDYEASGVAGIPFVFCKYGFGQVETPDYSIEEFSQLKNL